MRSAFSKEFYCTSGNKAQCYVHRYMLILTQTQIKQNSCQIFTNTSAGFLRTTVIVLQMD